MLEHRGLGQLYKQFTYFSYSEVISKRLVAKCFLRGHHGFCFFFFFNSIKLELYSENLILISNVFTLRY